MRYDEAVRHLFQVNLFQGMKLGLQNVQRLQQHLNYPDRKYASVHVAGTNGKGSVCTKIAAAFQQAGYRTGLYTSPHISCFRERIRINGTMISEDTVAKILTHLFELTEREQIPATFFELTTLLAFLYFEAENVDVAVIETGLGGKLDATNIIIPCLSVITSISKDHTEILGHTVDTIAKEKGGIIKPGVPVVIGPRVPQQVIRAIAKTNGSTCLVCSGDAATFEMENRLIAQESLKMLAQSFELTPKVIEEGLNGRQPCRFEVIHSSPPMILDVAHNPDGLAHLFKAVKSKFSKLPIRVLFGLSKNKDLAGCIKLLAENGSCFHVVEALNGRGASKEELVHLLTKQHVPIEAIATHHDVAEALAQATEAALKHGEVLVICGSFFIMGDVRQALGFAEPRDFSCMNER
jgi:dihydrofolate synthase / folylpolyglutamate synthase